MADAHGGKKPQQQKTGEKKEGASLTIQHLLFKGPRSQAEVSFRVMRGNKRVPNISARMFVGNDKDIFNSLLAIDTNDPKTKVPLLITTDNFGIARKKMDLSGFSYKEFNKFTIDIDDAKEQTVEMDSEAETQSKPLQTTKHKRYETDPPGGKIEHRNHKTAVVHKCRDDKGKPEAASIVFTSEKPSTLTDKTDPLNPVELAQDVTAFRIPVSNLGEAVIEVYSLGLHNRVTWTREDTHDTITHDIRFK